MFKTYAENLTPRDVSGKLGPVVRQVSDGITSFGWGMSSRLLTFVRSYTTDETLSMLGFVYNNSKRMLRSCYTLRIVGRQGKQKNRNVWALTRVLLLCTGRSLSRSDIEVVVQDVGGGNWFGRRSVHALLPNEKLYDSELQVCTVSGILCQIFKP